MIKITIKNSVEPVPILKIEKGAPSQEKSITSLVTRTLSLSRYVSSNPFPNQPVGLSFFSSNPFPNQLTPSSKLSQNEPELTSLPFPDEAGFKKESTSKKRKNSPNLLPTLKTHSPSCMEKRRATSRIKRLFRKPVHSFRIRAAKIDKAEMLEPNERGEIHCNGRTWGVHVNAGKGPRVYPKSGPGIYTFSGKELESVFNEYRTLKTPMKFEEFLIQRAAHEN